MNCNQCNEKLAVFSSYCENCGAKGPSFKEWCKIIGTSCIAFLKKRLWLTITIVGVLVFSIGFSILWGALTKFDPTDFVLTKTVGYDGNGRLQFSVDYTALCEKVIGPAPNIETKRGYEEYAEYKEKAATLENSLRISADRTSGLKNGDYFIITVEVLEPDVYRSMGVKITNGVYYETLQVGKDCDSFNTPVEINLFDYIEVNFDGKNGNGELSFDDELTETVLRFDSGDKVTMSTQCYESWGTYKIRIKLLETYETVAIDINVSKDGNLNNGDIVTISLNKTAVANLINSGIKISVFENTYTVSGLTE